MKPQQKEVEEEVDTVKCKLCSKTFVSEVAITNHVRMLHIDAYLSGDKDIWMKNIVIKSKEDMRREQQQVIRENTVSFLASMVPTSLTSLASEDVSYLVVKDAGGPKFVRTRRTKLKTLEEKPNKDLNSVPGPFECLQPSSGCADGLCHQMFFSCCEYSLHYSAEHSSKKKWHKCQVCEKTLSRLTENSQYPYNCQQCETGFETKKELSSHIDTVHSSLKPFECNICSKRFTQQGGLQQHLRMHTGERPYSCTFCTKTFTQKCGLYQHLRIHTNVKPYRCIVCDKMFSQLANMKRHMRSHTNVSPYECELCHRRFKQKKNLCTHLRVHRNTDVTDEQKKFELIDWNDHPVVLDALCEEIKIDQSEADQSGPIKWKTECDEDKESRDCDDMWMVEVLEN